MITDVDILYNRHLLSQYQIKTHYGLNADTHEFHNADILQTSDAFFRIVDALQSEKIDFIPLKGPVLSHLLYQDYTCRRFYDLDFLVDYNNVERFSRLLVDLSYHPVKEWPATRDEEERLRRNSNQFLFQREKTGTDVEIHWRLFPLYRFPDISFARLYNEHTVPYALDGRSIRKLSNELELLFLLIHGANHAWFRIKWLVDVSDYIRNVAVDYDVLRDMAAKNGFMKMIYYYNAIAKDYIPHACMIPAKKRTIPYYLKRYTDKEIRENENKDLRIVKKRSFGELMETTTTAFYLAPDSLSRYGIVKTFIGNVLPVEMVRLLKPIDRLIKKVFWKSNI